MTEISPTENANIDLASPVAEEISPYNPSYPVMLLSNSLKTRLALAQSAAMDIYNSVISDASVIAQVQQSMKKGTRLIVDASEETLRDINSGKIKLVTDKSGQMYAQIRNANGEFGSKLSIRQEVFRKGIDPVQMANALQMKALENRLKDIAEQLNAIGKNVREVLQGQQNDRIGLYYSGMALFLESRNVTDKDLKKSLIAQSLRALSEATFQITLNMQSDIQYLTDGEYKSAKGKRVDLIDARMHSIHQSFAFIHQSTMLRAGIYCDQGELTAMSTVLNEYSHFIDNIVVNNAPLLAQCDVSDNGTDEGVWKSRARMKLDVLDFTKQLNASDKTIYLGIAEEDA